MGSSYLLEAYRKAVPTSLRVRVFAAREQLKEVVRLMKLEPIQVGACLLGDENSAPGSTFARLSGDLLWASRPISEWPHVKLLREFQSIGNRIWEPGVFEKTEYYRMAALNIEIFGLYFDAVVPDQIHWGARRFVRACFGQDGLPDSAQIPDWPRDPHEHIAVHPVKYSSCFQVVEGHHRLAAAYVKGIKTISGLIQRPAVTTPLQDLLLDVLWTHGRHELYQPIESPEVADWTLLRRCTDRAAKMLQFLHEEDLMPPASRSYLDIACSYGWFVREMANSGFVAEGVETDPTATSIGKLVYGLRCEQLHRSDAVTFLKSEHRKFDVVSCFSLAHLYVLSRRNATPEELLHLLDAVTGRVLFFEMGEEHEHSGLRGWNPDFIHQWLRENTTFTRIVRLGKDEDRVPPHQHEFGRTLFACVR